LPSLSRSACGAAPCAALAGRGPAPQLRIRCRICETVYLGRQRRSFSSPAPEHRIRAKFEDIVLGFSRLFSVTGQRTQIALVSTEQDWTSCIALVLLASAGKFLCRGQAEWSRSQLVGPPVAFS
jgi:hypothetical protein